MEMTRFLETLYHTNFLLLQLWFLVLELTLTVGTGCWGDEMNDGNGWGMEINVGNQRDFGCLVKILMEGWLGLW